MAIFLFGFGAPSSFRLRFLPESAILKVFRVDKVTNSKNWRSVGIFFLAYHVRLHTVWPGYNSAEPNSWCISAGRFVSQTWQSS